MHSFGGVVRNRYSGLYLFKVVRKNQNINMEKMDLFFNDYLNNKTVDSLGKEKSVD